MCVFVECGDVRATAVCLVTIVLLKRNGNGRHFIILTLKVLPFWTRTIVLSVLVLTPHRGNTALVKQASQQHLAGTPVLRRPGTDVISSAASSHADVFLLSVHDPD